MRNKQQAGSAEARKLRDLASWYREFAERAGSPTIWETRLRMADDLDHEADRVERERLADIGSAAR